MGRSLSLSLRRREQPLLLAVAGACLVVCSLLPLVLLLGEVTLSWGGALAVLGSERIWALLARSLAISGAVTLLALGLGIPLGVLVGRTDVIGPRVAGLSHALPVFLPPFLLSLGWFHLLGARGIFGSEWTARGLFGAAGVIGILSLAFTPIATALVALALQGVDPSLEEAARVVASPARVVLRILLPAASPALALAAIIVFTLSFSELGVPMFLRVETFPAAVFARLGGIDFEPGEAFALVLPLLPLALLLLAVERRFAGSRSFAVLGLRGSQRETLRLGRWRAPASLLLWLFAAACAAPILALVWRAWWGGGFSEIGPWLGQAPSNSLLSGVVAATAITLIGLVVGHAVARGLPGARAWDTVAVLSFVTPAGVLGVGLIGLWNRPGLHFVYGSLAILVVGYVGRYAVIGVRTVACVVAQSPAHLEEAAATAGVGFAGRMTRIVGPLHRRGIGFAWLLALVFCLRDLETAVLFYPPGSEPTTVRIFTLEANGPGPLVAGLAVVHVAMTVGVLVLGGSWLLRGRTA